MAEPIGLIASIASILQITGAIAAYIHSVSSAPSTLALLTSELETLSSVLTSLHSLASSPSDGSRGIAGLEGVLQDFWKELAGVREELGGARGAREKWRWPFKEKDTRGFFVRVRNVCALAATALAVDQLWVALYAAEAKTPLMTRQ